MDADAEDSGQSAITEPTDAQIDEEGRVSLMHEPVDNGPTYHVKDSGRCPTNTLILTVAECEAAARYFPLPDLTAVDDGQSRASRNWS